MKLLILTVLLFVAACNEVDSEKDAKVKEEQLMGFNGRWSTDYIEFDKDQCAFVFESARTDSEFTLNKLLMDCRNKGTFGIFAPLHMKLASLDKASPYDTIAKNAPEGAQLLKISESDTFSSGWIKPTTGDMYLNMTNSELVFANDISFHANVRSSNLYVSFLAMRVGYKVDSTVEYKTVSSSDVALAQKSAWNSMILPVNARPSVASNDRNYLYCSEPNKTTPVVTLIDFTSHRYSVFPDRTIGEIGTVMFDGSVNMASTDYGRAFMMNGNLVYTLSVRMAGGRSTSMRIEFFDGLALLSSSSGVRLCQFIQNDVFAGKRGWNP